MIWYASRSLSLLYSTAYDGWVDEVLYNLCHSFSFLCVFLFWIFWAYWTGYYDLWVNISITSTTTH